jgi:hypothetical protein
LRGSLSHSNRKVIGIEKRRPGGRILSKSEIAEVQQAAWWQCDQIRRPFLTAIFWFVFRSQIALEPAKCPSVIVVNLPVTEITSAQRSMEIFIARESRLWLF